MEIVFAIGLGLLFGFVLQKVGAADPDKIIGMLTLKDLHLMKAILSGIGISSALLFLGLYFGVVDSGHLSIKAMYWGVPVGGLLLGFGWALAGFCPGTGVVALGSGRKDAGFFVAGGLVGAWVYALTYASFQDSWLLKDILGGKTALVTTNSKFPALIEASWSPLVAVAIGLLFLLIASILPTKLADRQ